MAKNSGQFKKGQTGNPKGRPRKGESAMDDLNRAIKKVEKEKRMSIYEHFLNRAYENDAVLMSLLKKKLPDLKQTDIESTIRAVVGLGSVPEALKDLVDGNKD